LPCGSETNKDLVMAILAESNRFCHDVLAPLNASGDQQGCQWREGQVKTPEGFKEAYHQFCDTGWPSMSQTPEFGGQGLPQSLGIVLAEMINSANSAWGMYPGLSQGAMYTIGAHGSDQQKQQYLPALISG